MKTRNISTPEAWPAIDLYEAAARLHERRYIVGRIVIGLLWCDPSRTLPIAQFAGCGARLFDDDLLVLFHVMQLTMKHDGESHHRFAKFALQRHDYWDDSEIAGNWRSSWWSDAKLDSLWSEGFTASPTATEEIKMHVAELVDIDNRLQRARQMHRLLTELLTGSDPCPPPKPKQQITNRRQMTARVTNRC